LHLIISVAVNAYSRCIHPYSNDQRGVTHDSGE
jgi:hypothetical protein